MIHDHGVIDVDRKLQSDPCPSLSAVQFQTQIIAYIVSCDPDPCESASFGPKHINEWCTSSITDMTGAFNLAGLDHSANFNDDISDWDVSSVKNMMHMFSYSVFNQDLNAWNVSSVTSIYAIFVSALNFNQDLRDWDLSQTEDTVGIFLDAIKFNQDLCSWVHTFQYGSRSRIFEGISYSTSIEPSEGSRGHFWQCK